MTHFGVIIPAALGHFNPLAALGRELQDRGHQITFLLVPDWENKVRAMGFNFVSIGATEYPLGTWPDVLDRVSRIDGLESIKFTIDTYKRQARFILAEAPDAIRQTGIEALIVDQSEPAGGTVAEYLKIPFVTVCAAMALNREAAIPPPIAPWQYKDVWWAKLRNQVTYRMLDFMARPILAVVLDYRQKWGLPGYNTLDKSGSPYAQISQQPAAFDFPRSELPLCFHYTGPLRHPALVRGEFPFEHLSGQPLIYASLGTIQNKRQEIFYTIAEACTGLDVQLVIAHGGGLDSAYAQTLPGNPLIVGYTPQLKVIERSSLVVTHAGMNTVLDSLKCGVPMVAVPIAHEQPAIANRISWTRTGVVVKPEHLSAISLRAAILQVLSNPLFLNAASEIKKSIEKSGGVKKAADICEKVANTSQPYLSVD